MSHLSDKELDRLSREAAEQHDVQQNTSGWDSLHLRLDKEMPVNPRRQRRSLLLLLSLLVLLTGSGLVYHFATAPTEPVVQKPGAVSANDELAGNPNQSSASEKVTGNRKPERDATNQDASNQKQSAPVTSGKNTPGIAGQDNLNQQPAPVPSNDDEQSNEKINRQPEKQTTNTSVFSKPNANRSNLKGNANRKESLAAIAASGNGTSANKKVLQQQPGNPVAVNDPEPSLGGLATAQALPDISKPAVDRNSVVTNDVLPASSLSNKAPKQTGRKFPLSLSIIGGADWTTVKFTHQENAGYNAGLTFTWHFARNFSVTTGAVYTKKNYSAYGKDYHPPKGYWTNYITLDEVNGSCWMIDVPLNLRYDFANGRKYSFFGSAGASTYFMDKESYSYHYWNNGNYYNRKWENNENSSHLFSILNISAGYEKTVSRNVSAQIEPYLKMPMSGIGFGNMQMSSYGLNFAIRYRPEFKKQNISVPVKNP